MCCLNGTTIYLADSSIARYSSGAVGYSLKPSAVQPQSSRALPFCRLECVPAFVVDAPTSSCAASSFEFLHVEESGQRPFSCYPLSAAALLRSLANAGGDRFRHLVRSLQNSHRHNRTLNIATIGGSVAMGAGAMGRGNHMGMPSTARFAAWLQWRHPEVRVTYRSFATPGSNSLSRVTGAGLDEVASARPDLLIWDYSSNDFSKHIFSSGGLRAVLEQLTRTVLSMPSRPTLLLLSLLSSGDLLRNGMTNDADGGWAMQDEALMPVCTHYDLPLVSYRDVIWPLNATQGASAAPSSRQPPHQDAW